MADMQRMKAMQVMSALSQPTRLRVFELLLSQYPGGMASGEIAEATKTIPSGMSVHLAILSRAGLVKSTKIGRSVLYEAVPAPIEGLQAFLKTFEPG